MIDYDENKKKKKSDTVGRECRDATIKSPSIDVPIPDADKTVILLF